MTTYTNIPTIYSPNHHSEGVSMHTQCSLNADRMRKRRLSSLNSHFSTQTSTVMRMLVMVVMMMCWGSAWGADEVLFSMDAKKDAEYSATNGTEIEMTSTHATITGGTVMVGSKRASTATNDDKFEKTSGFYFGTTNIYIKITLSQNLQAGDIIKYKSVIQNSAYNNLCFTKSNSRKTDYAGTESTEWQTYTITSADGFAGTNVIYIWRATNNSHSWDNLTVTRPEPTTDPQLSVSSSAVNVFSPSYESEISKKVTLTGSNLSDGTYDVTQPSVTGLSISPTQFTVASGSVSQEFTISYSSETAVTSSSADFTFATSDEDASVTVSATYGKNLKRNITEQATVSTAATWDFSTAASSNIALTGSTSPKYNEEYIYGTLAEIKNDATFNAAALKVKGQHAWYSGNGGTIQVDAIKFTSTVPGKVSVKFVNPEGTKNTKYLVINGVQKDYLSNSGSYTEANDIPVPAGEVIITGSDGTNVQQLRINKIVFTPQALDPLDISAETSAQNTPEGWAAVQLPSITLNKTLTCTLAAEGDNASTIQAAIDAANAAGGGRVIIPSGTWLSGPLVMKSNVVLHLSANCTLKLLPFGQYPSGDNTVVYDKSGNYKEKMFIGGGSSAVNDIVIEGEGTTSIIDGQGAAWWAQVTDDDKFERRPPLIRIKSGARHLFRNFKMQNAPGTNLTVGAGGNVNNVTVHDITISNPSSKAASPSHNTDGIPVWGHHVNIYNCNISTGDDNIVCDDGSQYVHAWGINCGDGHGMSFGSNLNNVHDIIYENITFTNTLAGFRLKTSRSGKSGYGDNAVRNITCQNSTMTGVADPFIITSWYNSTAPEPSAATATDVVATTPEFTDILFKDITVTNPGSGYTGEPHQYPIYIYGLPEMTVKNVTFDNVKIASAGKGAMIAYAEGVKFINGSTITGATSLYDTKTHHAYNDLTVVSATKAMTVGDADWTPTATTDYTTSGTGAISLSSSDESVATIVDGKVHAVAAGTTTITLTQAADGIHLGGSKTIELTVSAAFSNFEITLANTANITIPDGVTEVSKGSNNGTHGWMNYVFKFTTSCPVKVTMQKCFYGANAYVVVNGTQTSLDTKQTAQNCDGSVSAIFNNEGNSNVEIEVHCGDYCHFVKVEKYVKSYTSSEEYDAIIAAGEVNQLKQALADANGTSSKRFKIYLPNGTYDLGTDYNTMVNSYTTIVGESRDGVIIKNTPTTEGLNTSATLKTGSNVVLKDLTLQCTVANSGNAERGVALYDNGTNNAYQNIRLLGRQDVYYSDNSATSYFSDCEIHGTVDFICGGGSVWFERCTIKLVYRESGTDVIAAPNNSADKQGYTFNKCTIDNADASKSMAGRYNLARAWQNAPKCAFYQTTYNVAKPETLWGDDMSSGLTKTFTEDSENAASGSPAISLPAAPANVTISGNTLSWDAVDGASGYAIYRGTALIATVGSGVTSYDISSASSAKALAIRKTGASSSENYSVASISSEGVIGESAVATESAPAPEFKDFKAILATGKTGSLLDGLSGNVEFGVAVAADGTTTRVEKDAANSVATISGSVNGDHGLTNFKCKVNVPGAVKITVGTCSYDNNADLKVNNTSIIAEPFTGDKSSKCWKNQTYNVLRGLYTGEAGDVEITKGGYTPYIAIEGFKPVDEFALDFTTGGNAANVYKDSENNTILEGEGGNEKEIGISLDDPDSPVFSSETFGSDVTFFGKINGNTYGVCGTATFTVPVSGPVKITYGKTPYSTQDVKITTVKGVAVATIPQAKLTGDVYSSTVTTNVESAYYSGAEPTILICTGGKYIPYFAVEPYTPEPELVDETIFSMDVASTVNDKVSFPAGQTDLTSANAVITGGSVKVCNGQSSAKVLINAQNNIYYFTHTNGNTTFKVTLNKALAAGDVISATIPNNTAERGLIISSTKTSTPSSIDGLVCIKGANTTSLTYKIKSTDTDIVGKTEFYILRATGNSTYFKDFKIVRSAPRAARTFTNFKIDFTKEWANSTSIVQNATYYITATTDDGIPTMTTEEPEKYLAKFKGKYHGTTYGVYNTELVVPVDGPVKFTYGANNYGGDVVGKNTEGSEVVKFSNYNASCWNNTTNTGLVGTKNYNSMNPTTITLKIVSKNTYVPYIAAEACDFTPVCETPSQEKVAYVAGTTSWTYKLSTATETAHLKYKIGDGAETTIENKSGNVDIPYGSRVEVWAIDHAGVLEESEHLVFTADAQPQMAAPSIACDDDYNVTITTNDKTSGAKTYYTTDGTDPTAESTEYSAAFSVTENKTIKAITILAGYVNSTITTLPITFKALKPVVVLAADKTKVTITNKETGGTVYYTVDGSEPTTAHYDGMFTEATHDIPVYESCQIKSFTVKDGVPNSDVVTYFCRTHFNEFAWDFAKTGNKFLGGGAVDTGVVVDDDGNAHLCAKGDISSSINVKTAWHDDQHGYQGWNATIPVDGNVDIYLGNCAYGGTMTIKNGLNSETLSINQKEANNCYDGDKAKNFKVVHYVGDATTLTISGFGGYIPYFAVKDVRSASDLTKVNGDINVIRNESYTLNDEVTDFTGTGTFRYVSSNPSIATVDATGKITAGSTYGQTTITVYSSGSSTMKPGKIQFTVRVTSAAGQTHTPVVSIAADGAVTITKSSAEDASDIYYTLDGSTPTTTESATCKKYTSVISAAEASGKVIKVIAVTTDKSPSDVVKAYVNISGTFTWAWNEGGTVSLLPEVMGDVAGAYDENSKATYNNESFTQKGVNLSGNESQKLAGFESKKIIGNPEEASAITFNIIPVAGVSFKPTSVSYDVLRNGTSSGLLDVKLVSESNTYNLFTQQKPTLDQIVSYSPTITSVEGAAEEWALKMYLYSLSRGKNWGLRNVVICGTFSGVEYDGTFYDIYASPEPAAGGSVLHAPSASKVVPGKKVTFTATPNTGYKFVKWMDMDTNETVGESTTYTVNSLSSNLVLEAQFEALPKITFNNNNSQLTGTVPAVTYTNADHTFTIPENTTLYREGWAVTGWKNGDDEYPIGSVQTFDADVTLTPIVTQCEKALTDVNDAVSVVWPFDLTDGAPAIHINDGSSYPTSITYVKATTVNGCRIDVPLILSGAKMDNTDARVNRLDDGEDVSKPAKGGQLNNNSILNIPAVPGMIVKLKASGKIDLDYSNNVTNFTDETEATRASIAFYNAGTTTAATGEVTTTEKKEVTYTYSGDEKSIDLKIINGGTNNQWGFFEYLEVIYPVLPDIELANTITYSEGDVAFSTEKVVNAGSSTKTASTHPNTGKRYKKDDEVTITATAGYGYKLTGFTCNKGSLGTPTIADGGASGTVIYKVGSETGTVTAKYERLPMGKVRLESVDDKLGEVDFASGSKFENFYTKGADYVESYFVVGGSATAIATAADDYVIDKWTSGSATGSTESIANQCKITVTAEAQTFFAHFTHGKMGSVTFDIEHPVIVEGETTKALPADFGSAYDSTDNAVSQAPASVTNSYSFTVPKYSTVFKTGYTLKFWKEKDGERTYALGTNSSFQTENESLILVPVYEKNPTTQFNRLNEPIMTYEFGTGKGIRAQKVNLGKNTKTFWTAQVWVEAIDKTIKYPHWRDVGVWIQTGSKGFVRNGDLDEWASFGEGTKFYIASCAGTRIELLTYAPITTTTFGGEVFTLKEKVSEHEYLYECTTQLTDQRVPIVIGDDYSYYKYFKVYSKMADRVNLHINVDDAARGKITQIEAINSSEDVQEPIKELEDGGHSFNQGNGVKVTIKRRFGFEFDKIIDPDKTDAEGNPLAVLERLDNGHVKMVKLGNGTETEEITVANADGSWGDINNHVFLFKETECEMTSDSLRTQYEVSFNITTHRNLQVYFKEKPTYYVTFNPGSYATGTAPAAQWKEKGDKFEIPENHTLYYEGNTLKYWVDSNYDYSKTKADNVTAGCKIYDLGEKPTLTKNWETAPKEDYNLRLFPVFEKNAFTILDVTDESGWTAKWPFAKKEGAPVINFERTSGILVTRLENGKTAGADGYDWIDLKADLDASDKVVDGNKVKGKFFNDSDGGEARCQINNNSVMTFPTTKNCNISLYATNNFATDASSRTIVAGSTNYDAGKTANVTYQGDESSQTVEFKNDGKYYTKFTVTYKPQTVTKPELTSVKYGDVVLDLATLKSEHLLKNVDATVNATTEAMATVSATADNGSVTVTQPTVDNPQSIITLKTDGGIIIDTYTIIFTPTLPEGAPALQFLGFEINGQPYDNGATVEEMPVSGYIKLKFNRTMKATEIGSGVQGSSAKYTAEQGKDVVFKYWNLSPETMSDFYVPVTYNQTYKIFEDIYGNVYAEKDLSLHLRFSSTTIPVEHRTFDYIVGKDGNLEQAISAANADTGTDRYYVFIPDGDYKLEGNENVTISNTTSDGTTPCDRTGKPSSKAGTTVNNGMTIVSRKNVSLIGQSMNGVVLHNDPDVEGIGYTATIHVDKKATDFYAEELSLRNDFPYWDCMNGGSNAARAVCFWDQGNKTILKNVSMMSWQDTYYSSNSSNDHRAYWEDCTLGGIIDWACGDGDVWWERCDIVIRDRSGNNLAAPHTEPGQQWGYVFNNCRIMPEPGVEMKDLKDKTWTLARPWGAAGAQEPACTFLYSKISVLPKDAGWGPMSGGGMVLRFHEYKSGDANGNLISLGARSLAASNPAAGSDDCILTDELAAKYTLNNVLGGGDGFTPNKFTQQIDAASSTSGKDANNYHVWNDNIEIDDDYLQWNTEPMALCYFIFKKEDGKWVYKTNIAQTANDVTRFNLSDYGTGFYCVRAANQRGGLGAPTKEIEYVLSQKYTLTLKEVKYQGADGNVVTGMGWSTICLPYNSKVPTTMKDGAAADLKVYAGISISDYTMSLKAVDFINKELGYVVYGPVGEYVFTSSSHTTDIETILIGNPKSEAIPTGNNNGYVLANKSTYGLGFYKYTGATLAGNRAWLPIENVPADSQEQSKAIKLVIVDEDADAIIDVRMDADDNDEKIYDLNGQRVSVPIRGRLYIINGKKMVYK